MTARIESSQDIRQRRFTIDGSDQLEQELAELCARTAHAVTTTLPAACVDGLLLGGGYGRGEGGVLKTPGGDQPYNDIEFYLLLKPPFLWNKHRHSPAIQRMTAELTASAGVHVEVTPISRAKLRLSPPSMFYYDLIARHRRVLGPPKLLAECQHHLNAAAIPASEATRLLMNRCSGLLFAFERLTRNPLSPDDLDFIGRNLAKLQLALGDVVLTLAGQYHWSCRTRHARLRQLQPPPDLPCFDLIVDEHVSGVAFKLHPKRSSEEAGPLLERARELAHLALAVWLFLETRRLNSTFRSAAEYALSPANKCPETKAWRNALAQIDAFGPRAIVRAVACRNPRERLLIALPLLLWERHRLKEPSLLRAVQGALHTSASNFKDLVRAYREAWSRLN